MATAVFTIVMTAAMGALMNVIDANSKARSIKTAINNLSFAIEGISKDMRLGSDYNCGNNGEPTSTDCPGGGNIIKYRSQRADPVDVSDPTGLKKYAYYKFEGNKIKLCLEVGGVTCSYSNPSAFNPITSAEVVIAPSSKFYIIGVTSLAQQPRMVISIQGEAGVKEKIKTDFNLQTSISQREYRQ